MGDNIEGIAGQRVAIKIGEMFYKNDVDGCSALLRREGYARVQVPAPLGTETGYPGLPSAGLKVSRAGLLVRST